MGSCISPVVANIFMEHIECSALTTFRKPSRIWLRYVDDVYCVIKSSVIDDFHHHVNSISSNIKFTLELEDNSSLAFLDVRVNHTVNCKLWTTIYDKPTHTDRYLQIDSHHPLHHKLAVARTLYHRIDSHIQKTSERKFDLDLTKKTLTLNGFLLDLPFPFLRVKPISQLVLNFFWIHNPTLHRRCIGQNQANTFRNRCSCGVQTIFNHWQISPFPKTSNKSQ